MTVSACSHIQHEADLSGMSSANTLRNDFLTATGGKPAPVTAAEGLAIPERHFRIDGGHALPATKPTKLEPVVANQDPKSPGLAAGNDEPNTQQSWLQLHAVELIEKLQFWSADLDAREAQLNARTALLEHRERQLRLEQQNSRLDAEALTQSLQQEVAEIRAVARRLAFE